MMLTPDGPKTICSEVVVSKSKNELKSKIDVYIKK